MATIAKMSMSIYGMLFIFFYYRSLALFMYYIVFQYHNETLIWQIKKKIQIQTI